MKPLVPPLAGSSLLKSSAQPWQPTDAAGFWIKRLFEDEATAVRTALMKIDAGAFYPLHAHDETEQVYVLEGEFHDQDRSYGPGDFILRAPGAPHTAGSRDGAIVLLVYTRSPG